MNEFEFDKAYADRITKIVQMYPMSLSDCADILETVAPLCAMWTPEGFLKRIHGAFRNNQDNISRTYAISQIDLALEEVNNDDEREQMQRFRDFLTVLPDVFDSYNGEIG